MTLQASVSMSWVNTVLAAAERAGVARERLLAQAGIAPVELVHERWPIDHITRLWRAAVHCTQDPGFGLKVGAQVGFNSMGISCCFRSIRFKSSSWERALSCSFFMKVALPVGTRKKIWWAAAPCSIAKSVIASTS